MRVFLLLSLLCVVNVICQNFFILSDIHYDPFYDPTQSTTTFCRDNTTKLRSSHAQYSEEANLPIYGQYGCDTPYPLLISTLEAMKSVNSKPDFILIGGDTSAHEMPAWEQTMLAITNVTYTIDSYFPGVPIFPCLGNNDLFPDYQMPLGPNELLNSQTSLWESTGWLTSENAESFENGGFYIRELVPGYQLIVLNTVVYDKNWCPENGSICVTGGNAGDDPLDQFAWLTEQLTNIEQSGQKAILMSHISPGVDVKFSGLWHKQYATAFQDIYGNYTNTIAFAFFSHLHRDAFRLVYDASGSNLLGALMLSSSISPKDFNNPSFRYVSYDRSTFELLDYTDYYADLSQTLQGAAPNWQQLYTFSTTYNLQGVNAKSYLALYEALDSWSDEPWDTWINYYVVNSNQDFPYYPADDYLCSLRCVSDSCYDNCAS